MWRALRHVHPTAYNEYTHLPQKDLVEIDRKSMIEFCKAVFSFIGGKGQSSRESHGADQR